MSEPDVVSHTCWEETIEKCIKSIVSIKVCRTRGLDTEFPGSFIATGFVVDTQHGIILSNRHVVSVSPVKAYAILCNYEEIELKPIYRDPVHDFGFFQYDTTKIRFLDIPGIDLYPQGAKIGQDIRVVGNDAGEKLSILSGTLAKLDRETPDYGTNEYNDFNTFYYQAASSTSVGSSGSPVLDLQGRAIALNAGCAYNSSSSYYLPLDRAQRALSLLIAGQPVPRGTIQVTFEYQSYDNLRQLGLSRYLERGLREQQKESKGLLVVKTILQDGPAYGYLEPGDILLACNRHILLSRLFIDLEEHLDTIIAQQDTPPYITLMVLRGGEPKEITLQVQDLHSITPFRYVEFGGGVLNDVSYQIARLHGLSLKNPGVYVGTPGYILGSTACVLRQSIIVGVNHKPVRSLDEFISVVQEIEQGERVPIHFYSLSRPMKIKIAIIHIDWRWHQFRMATRNDITGYWDYSVLETSLTKSYTPRSLIPKLEKSLIHNENNFIKDPIKNLTKSIVSIDCCPPFIIDGSKNAHSYGAGIIVSLNPPLIICDRDTVPIHMSVISVTFDNSLTIPAELVFLHPFYNFAILKFDPTPIIKADIQMYVAELTEDEFAIGDKVTYVGLSGSNEVHIKTTTIISLSPIRARETVPPRWRAINVEVFKVSDGTLGSQGGLFADQQGKVRAIWMTFSIDNDKNELSSILAGLSCRLIKRVMDTIKLGQNPNIRGLDIEFWPLQISNARLVGVPDKWIDRIKQGAGRRQASVVYVLGITDKSSLSGQLLKPGDILLAIEDHTITCISDLKYIHDYEYVPMTILRDGKEQNLIVPTTKYDGQETTEVVGWQGMLLQQAHQAAKEQVQKQVPEGIYVSCCLCGSPAQASLLPNIWITQIDQVPVTTLDQFLKVIQRSNRVQEKYSSNIQRQKHVLNCMLTLPAEIEEQDIEKEETLKYVQIKYATMDNVMHVKAIRLDTHYWPTWHIKKDTSSPYDWKLTFPT
ncbi:uncharacterized protein BX663DRAFT_430081 [Cokeromyces recurvatus]|uniref:uncharacterized protein n=1 Tax=Cokeromyces recurvatus TaxID=90255 RepID=UPI00222117ED|nr:uncharacterized protein BX663DRAFT_430081 [Cokeromyces recurvatus]KAI7904922.1 hypothetical protein BX663DRAFT_430081 [Cokeromyces recurvatus]